MSACTVNTENAHKSYYLPDFNHALIQKNTPYNVTSIKNLTRLSEAQRQELQAFISKDDMKDLPNRLKVAHFINDKMVNFNYEGRNSTSSESWESKSGNCMALALLTYSIAKELGVYPVFQVVYASPVLTNITSDLLVTSDHVRTFLYDEQPSGHYLSGSTSTVIDYFPDRFDRTGAIVSENEFLAMFYRNLAADALLLHNYEHAFVLLKQGFTLAPEYEPLINMMAIVHRRLGDNVTAEKLYRYGLNIEPSSLTILSNYRLLLELQGRKDDVAKIEQQLLSIESSNPYRYYSLGIEALEFEDYYRTIIFLEKFIKSAPYFHQAYLALAKAQLGLGNTKKAQKILKQAVELTDIPENKKYYLTKLEALNNTLH
ncbi:tetratricopeptide repeat protein [Shewanella holmiensis]|uniref:Tetratricopeptide repeat protein n=1 Tax=Shewanella holmiensis TaxID=2952222 RepID=A0A9X2WP88_9GAMM|nr:hypothetical protein [Shewanella holmiensis]MCT7943071.1 hypothetical protein [Shewanella holmiensis]